MSDQGSISSLGEFALIERIQSVLDTTSAITGIGDDAAVLDLVGDEYLLATVDMLVDDVHFRLAHGNARNIGRRALACNISDIAAMGGRPTFALVSLALPPELETHMVLELYRGMHQLATEMGASIVGGNMTRTDGPLCIDVTVLGLVMKTDVMLRSGAKQGDALAVTGTLGDSAAVRLVEGLPQWQRDEWASFCEAHSFPVPRLAAGQALARSHVAHALIDISDGLAGDVRHVADASGVGVVLEEAALPISREARQISTTMGLDPAAVAMRGGEDYELLVALDADKIETAQRMLEPVGLTRIGTVTERKDGLRISREDGTVIPLPVGGWTHF